MKKLTVSIACIMIFGCFFTESYGENAKNVLKHSKTVKETYISPYNENDNIDSPMFFTGKDGIPMIAATAKESDKIFIYNGIKGSVEGQIGSSGTGAMQFRRPNGIFSTGKAAIVVERDNHRVQVLSLPDFVYMGTFGDSLLIKPYGIYADYLADGSIMAFITNNYEKDNSEIPPLNELGERVKIFRIEEKTKGISWEFVKAFGDTSGDGVLKIVESIYGDPENNNLLIAEEDSSSNDIKVYSFDGRFSGKTLGKGIFKYQVEGIALWKTDGKSGGYWVTTDQGPDKSVFHIFDRVSFDYKGSFEGEITANTDGITLTTEKFGLFEEGALIAVNDDGGISAFSLKQIKDVLGLK